MTRRCKENQPTFQALLAIKQKMARMDVGGGMSTVGPSGPQLGDQAMMKINKGYAEYAN
jgi:hypothetical protein